MKIDNTHSKSAIFYALASGFERASYYGIRSILILFLVSETIEMATSDVLDFFGWFTIITYVSMLLGALLGDFVYGNRKLILIGVIIQIIGYGILCFQTKTSIYVGWGLVLFGSGVFSSNIIAEFGKKYLKTRRLLDAGFTLYYVAINIGATLGVLLIGYLGDINFNYGFTLAILLTIGTLVSAWLANNKFEIQDINYKFSISLGKRRRYIVLVIVITGLFWVVYQASFFGIANMQKDIFQGFDEIPEAILHTGLNNYLGMGVMVILTVVWSHIYTNSFFKLLLGLIFTAGSFAVLLLTPENSNSISISTYVIAMLLLSTGEMLISPILNSVVTRLTKPKYLAITLIVVAIPGGLFNSISTYLSEHIVEINTNLIFLGSALALLVLAVPTYYFSKAYKKDESIYLSKEAEEFLAR